mgnify:CR=1 FL=1
MQNKTLSNLTEKVENALDKVQTPTTRAGNTVERVGKMYESGVDPDVIALQMTKKSPTKKRYTRRDVETLNAVYQDAKSCVLITASQAKSLMQDQINVDEESLVSSS